MAIALIVFHPLYFVAISAPSMVPFPLRFMVSGPFGNIKFYLPYATSATRKIKSWHGGCRLWLLVSVSTCLLGTPLNLTTF